MTSPQRSANRKFFFAYAREDSDFVLRLATDLRDKGVNVWMDQLDVLGGQRWDHAVESALQRCDGMIAVLSPKSVASQNVMDEISYALEEGKLLIPILLQPAPMPFRLRRVQYVDFSANHDAGFAQLLRAIENAAHGRPITDERTPLRHPQSTGGMVQSPGAAETAQRAGALPNKRTWLAKVAMALLFLVAAIVSMALSMPGNFDAIGAGPAWAALISATTTGALIGRDRARLRAAGIGALIGAVVGGTTPLPFFTFGLALRIVNGAIAGGLAGVLSYANRRIMFGAVLGLLALELVSLLLGGLVEAMLAVYGGVLGALITRVYAKEKRPPQPGAA